MLARTLGRTLGELETSMTHREYVLWLAEYSREPWGELRDELRMGRICEVTVNSHSAKARTRPRDFMFSFDRKAATTPEDMKQAGMAWVAAMGGKIIKKGEA